MAQKCCFVRLRGLCELGPCVPGHPAEARLTVAGRENWADGGVGLSTRCLPLWAWKTAQSKQQPAHTRGGHGCPGRDAARAEAAFQRRGHWTGVSQVSRSSAGGRGGTEPARRDRPCSEQWDLRTDLEGPDGVPRGTGLDRAGGSPSAEQALPADTQPAERRVLGSLYRTASFPARRCPFTGPGRLPKRSRSFRRPRGPPPRGPGAQRPGRRSPQQGPGAGCGVRAGGEGHGASGPGGGGHPGGLQRPGGGPPFSGTRSRIYERDRNSAGLKPFTNPRATLWVRLGHRRARRREGAGPQPRRRRSAGRGHVRTARACAEGLPTVRTRRPAICACAGQTERPAAYAGRGVGRQC